ncbi:MAG: hypothetical protein GY866_24545 [Proteobacteria bacterium]|nr:hypothetical protein [Pseudomonadota bacterium]
MILLFQINQRNNLWRKHEKAVDSVDYFSLTVLIGCKTTEEETDETTPVVENNSSTAASASTVPVGDSNCPFGGIKVETGIDENGNGDLDSNEVDNTEYVCNGANGQDGTDGANGGNGQDGTNGSNGVNSLVKLTDVPPGGGCSAGGIKIEVGIDNGDGGETAGDDILQAGEIDSTAFFCETSYPPTNPSISINGGDSLTDSLDVTLTLSADDDIGVTGYYASETNTEPSASAAGWTPVTSTTGYSADVSFTLSSGEGTKIVYIWFKDAAGNISSRESGTIELITPDTTAPMGPTLSIDSDASSTFSRSVTLNLSADDDIGVTGYYASETSTEPSASAAGWTPVTSTTGYSADVSFTLSSEEGTKIVYIWFKDTDTADR